MAELPQDEGRLSPEEAASHVDSLLERFPNQASDRDRAANALKFVQDTVQEWTERMRPLHLRWRASNYMLQGNTLDRSTPVDVHVPEIYKAMETITPRIEEVIVEEDPFFRVIPRRKAHEMEGETISAYMDWIFDQARVRDQIQGAIRDMLVSQSPAAYTYWDYKTITEQVPTVTKTMEDGVMKKKVTYEEKEVVIECGPKLHLVDPFDFIIDTKATSPQDAMFVGHRVWMDLSEIEQLGKRRGWVNLETLKTKGGSKSVSLGQEADYYQWSRDPASRYGDSNTKYDRVQGRPEKFEVVFLHSLFDPTGDGENFQDYSMVVVGGTACVELRENFYRRKRRPYATGRISKGGHEFYGIGPLDNAIRLNQHLDTLYATQVRSSQLTGGPLVFTSEDAELPDNLWKARPLTVFQGVGDVKFTNIPEGSIVGMQTAINSLRSNIEETIGSFRIQMGQEMTGGTATEATLSLQEGNRRMRGMIRAMGDFLTQVLENFYGLVQQFSTEDIEFPVLGKRAVDLRQNYMTVSPADLLSDVKFELVGLKSVRNYGMKTAGLTAFAQSMAPFIVQNPNHVDQIKLMHMFASEMIGQEAADEIVKVPTAPDKLKPQSEENEGLLHGESIFVDDEDDHEEHIMEMADIVARATDENSGMPDQVKKVVMEHFLTHRLKLQRKEAQEAARQRQKPESAGAAGGAAAAGGFEPSETNGPPDPNRTQSSASEGSNISQLENSNRE